MLKSVLGALSMSIAALAIDAGTPDSDDKLLGGNATMAELSTDPPGMSQAAEEDQAFQHAQLNTEALATGLIKATLRSGLGSWLSKIAKNIQLSSFKSSYHPAPSAGCSSSASMR